MKRHDAAYHFVTNIKKYKIINSVVLFHYPPLGGAGGGYKRAKRYRSPAAQRLGGQRRGGRAARSGVTRSAGAARSGVTRSASAGRERSERLRARPGGGRGAPAPWGWPRCAPCSPLVGVGGWVGTSAKRYLSPPIGGLKGSSIADGGSIFAVNCKNTAVIPIGGYNIPPQMLDF